MMHYHFARSHIFRLLLIICTLFIHGCAPYKISTQKLVIQDQIRIPSNLSPREEQVFLNNYYTSANHWLYNYIPRHRCQIRWFDIGHWCTWMLFGNDDDGIFGEGRRANFRPCLQPSLRKAICWNIRNPLHNFCFYVAGSAHCQNSRLTFLEISRHGIQILNYSPRAKGTFPDEYSCFLLALNGWKPYFSLRLTYSRCRRADFYLGWRSRGNFGIKFLPFAKRKYKPQQAEKIGIML